jgi:hypothetical protein
MCAINTRVNLSKIDALLGSSPIGNEFGVNLSKIDALLGSSPIGNEFGVKKGLRYPLLSF